VVLWRQIVDELFGTAAARCRALLTTQIKECLTHLTKAAEHRVSLLPWASLEHLTHWPHVLKHLTKEARFIHHSHTHHLRDLLAWHLLLVSLVLLLASHVAIST